MSRILGCSIALVLAISCASPPLSPPGDGGAWGYVRLVPHEGVEVGPAAGAYGDRRLKDVRLVDYTRPGFVVVYAEGDTSSGGTARLVLRPGVSGARLEPQLSAVERGGTIEIRNETARPQVLSAREVGRLVTLAPDASVRFPATQVGENGFFILSEANGDARVFVSPGPFALASESGRFELPGIGPGRRRLVAWHPRFPSTAHWVELVAGETTRVDIELGVDRPREVGQ